MMINKFSLNYINYRLHQLFYFRQIIKRDSFNILIDKKIIPLYNIKNFILRFHHHEHEEIKLIKKNLFPTNTLELGCSLGITSFNIKKIIDKNILCSIDGNLNAIRYCYENLKINPNFDIQFIHHVIGGDKNFSVNNHNFMSSSLNIDIPDEKDILISIEFINEIINKNKIKALVLDIEGMEKFILDQMNLSVIDILFLELHPTIYGAEQENLIIEKLNEKGFKIRDFINSNYCFEKR